MLVAHAPITPMNAKAHRCGAEQYPIGSGYPLPGATFSDPSNEVVAVSKVVRHDPGRRPYVLGYLYLLRNKRTFYEASPNLLPFARNDQREFLRETGIINARRTEAEVDQWLTSPRPFSMPALLTPHALEKASAQILPCTSLGS